VTRRPGISRESDGLTDTVITCQPADDRAGWFVFALVRVTRKRAHGRTFFIADEELLPAATALLRVMTRADMAEAIKRAKR
jgi:hypothetical protein